MAVIDKADEAQLLATIDRWIEREVAPRVKEFDHADRWPAEIVEQMKELGLFGATISPEYGGLGLPARTYAEIVMRVSSVWMAITGIFNSHLMLALAVEKFGTERQKQQWPLHLRAMPAALLPPAAQPLLPLPAAYALQSSALANTQQSARHSSA